MGARDEPDLDADGPDLGQTATVDADALVEDELADRLLLDEAEQALADARIAARDFEQAGRVATRALGADRVGDRRPEGRDPTGQVVREPDQEVRGRLGVRERPMALAQFDAEEARQVTRACTTRRPG